MTSTHTRKHLLAANTELRARLQACNPESRVQLKARLKATREEVKAQTEMIGRLKENITDALATIGTLKAQVVALTSAEEAKK